MKNCPTCSRTYEDTLTFCLVDGAILSPAYDPKVTLEYPETRRTEPPPTEVLPGMNSETTIPAKPEIKPPQFLSNTKEREPVKPRRSVV